MAYSDFTIESAVERCGLQVVGPVDLFGEVPPVAVRPSVQETLTEQTPVATAVHFPADPAQGLSGTCDFLLSRSPEQEFILAPIVAIVEAKNGNLKAALGQCIAAMLGARTYNEREGQPVATVFGVVTTGTSWQFLRLDGPTVRLDPREYQVEQLVQILGILRSMLVDPEGLPAAVESEGGDA